MSYKIVLYADYTHPYIYNKSRGERGYSSEEIAERIYYKYRTDIKKTVCLGIYSSKMEAWEAREKYEEYEVEVGDDEFFRPYSRFHTDKIDDTTVVEEHLISTGVYTPHKPPRRTQDPEDYNPVQYEDEVPEEERWYNFW